MTSCNVVFGRTGCGKTSLKNMLCGQDPEPDSLTSGTKDAEVFPFTIKDESVLYVDTAGILDNRGDGLELSASRAAKVNTIGDLLKQRQFFVARVFYCVASAERILKEELDWLADILQMLGGKQVLANFCIVLTKVDAGFQKKKFEKGFEDNELVKALRNAFPNCPIVTAGHENMESLEKLLIPASTVPDSAVKPAAIKTITPKADLETTMKQTQARLSAVTAALADKSATKEGNKDRVAELEAEIETLQESITNGGWWCPDEDVKEYKKRVLECNRTIKDLKSNGLKTEEDKQNFERQMQSLIRVIRDAELELKEKASLVQFFMALLTRKKVEGDKTEKDETEKDHL